MRKHMVCGFPFWLMGTLIIWGIDHHVGYAANSLDSFSTGLPWDNVLKDVGQSLTGPVPQAFAALATAMAGLMLIFGESGGMFKRSLQIVVGIGIALNVSSWISTILSPVIGDSGTAVPSPPTFTDENFISSFMSYVIAACQNGATKMQPYALATLGALSVIEMSLDTAMNLERDHLKYLLRQTLTVGFFVFLIQNWINGSYHLATVIFQSFQQLGLIAGGVELSQLAPPDQIVHSGINIVSAMYNALPSGIGNFGVIIVDLLAMAGILLTTFFTAIEIFMVTVEFWILSAICIPLLPFGMLKFTRFLFEKSIGLVYSLGIKVMVITFLATFSANMFAVMAKTLISSPGVMPNFSTILSVLLGCCVLYKLIQKAPDVAMSLLSGHPTLSGSGTAGMTMAPVRGVAAATGLVQAAQVMPGGGATNGGSTTGTMRNVTSLGLTKATAPFTRSMAGNLDSYTQFRRMKGHLDGSNIYDHKTDLHGQNMRNYTKAVLEKAKDEAQAENKK